MNGPSAADALLSLALPSSSAERPSTSRRLTSLPSVAPTILPLLCGDDGDLRLRIVPGRDRVQPDIGAEPDRRHRLAFGEDLRVRPDADLEILRPGAARDELGLDRHRLFGAGLQLGEIVADQPGDIGADGVGLFSRAARLLLDDPFEQADHEGDAGSLHRLQVDGRKQIGLRRIAAVFEAVGGDSVERADRLALGGADIAGRHRPSRRRRARSAHRST